MRRFRLFVSSEPAEPESEVLSTATELSTKAEDYISIGKKVIEPLLKDPTVAIVVTNDLKMALFAFKEAAEAYEKIKAWDDAVFAWSMIEAVPVDPKMKWGAPGRIEICKRNLLTPHPPSGL